MVCCYRVRFVNFNLFLLLNSAVLIFNFSNPPYHNYISPPPKLQSCFLRLISHALLTCINDTRPFLYLPLLTLHSLQTFSSFPSYIHIPFLLSALRGSSLRTTVHITMSGDERTLGLSAEEVKAVCAEPDPSTKVRLMHQ